MQHDDHPVSTEPRAGRPGAASTSEEILRAEVARLEHEVDGLRTAMEARALIEQAKGMIMLRDKCDAEEAFRTLVHFSQHSQLKLRDVAARVVGWGSAYEADAAGQAAGAPTAVSGVDGVSSGVRGLHELGGDVLERAAGAEGLEAEARERL